MIRAKGRKKVQEMFFFAAALLFILFFIGSADLHSRSVTSAQTAVTAAGFAAMIALTPLLIRLAGGIGSAGSPVVRSDALRVILLLALAVLPRLAWWLNVEPRIDSDYGLYVRMGAYYAETGRAEMSNYLLAVAPNAVTYSFYTGMLMRVFGTSADTLVRASMVLHVCNILLVYGVGRTMTSGVRAFCAAAVFALLPENVFYSHLPGIEAPAMFTGLLGLLTALGGRKSLRRGVRGTLYFCGGAMLALSAGIRPNAWAVLAAMVLMLLREEKTAFAARRRLLRLLPLIAGVAVLFFCQQALNARLFRDEKPVSGLGWSLYEGLDLESGGKWTPEKSARCVEVINAHDPEEADRIFMAEALERYRGYSFPEKARLFLRKGGSLWYETRYSVFSAEGTAAYEDLDHLARICWSACIAACIYGLLYRTRNRLNPAACPAAGLPLTVLLLTTAWHQAGTSIGRYHYMLIPFLLLLAVTILPGRAELVRPERRRPK